MLDVAPTELLLVAFVALVVIGPKDLPKALRVIGHWVGRARGVARQFRSGFDTMVREAELEEMEKRWASENERIMKEHAADTSAVQADGDTHGEGDVARIPAAGDEPAHDPFGVEPDPVLVHKPDVTPAPVPAKSDGSPS